MNQNKSYHALAKLEKAYSVEIEYRNSYGTSYVSIFPYNDESLIETIKDFAIKAPFEKIIDRGMGISTCGTCGARYAGHQEKCVNKDYFYAVYSDRYKTLAKAKERCGYYDSITEGWMECHNRCTWDLENQFNKQKSFFSMVELVRSIVNTSSQSLIDQYKDCFVPGFAEKLVVQKMYQDIFELQMTIQRHKEVIQEMINRMQSAGNMLSCGSL